ncbi:glycosyltransferase family 2 protein [Bdellovibrionota bacterium FG-2]
MRNECAIIVPAYNEAKQIAKTIAGLRSAFSTVIVVDDGSSDQTSDEAQKAGATIVRHVINLGQGGALHTGFRFALEQLHSKFIATFDADGQHRIENLVGMYDFLIQHPETDVLIGSRFLNKKSISMIPPRRRLLLRIGTRISRWIHKINITDTHNGLRIFRSEALAQMELKLSGMDHASEILEEISLKNLRFQEFPVEITYSEYSQAKGQSGLNALRILYNFFVHRNI